MTNRTWSRLSTRERQGIVLGGVAQFALAGWAWCDLARRPAALVNGPKRVWAAVIAVNFVGPVAYWRWGRTATAGARRFSR
ncbi:PLDc N-terminal domain-containing protein [Actinokineospora guangxiensis]|uniref:PLDc N-terminal domain-containing protein n=1 Tax=Actinokineospora guangxiensis TaxID=1490288 RepID=A0ABW0EVF1_9PSEU